MPTINNLQYIPCAPLRPYRMSYPFSARTGPFLLSSKPLCTPHQHPILSLRISTTEPAPAIMLFLRTEKPSHRLLSHGRTGIPLPFYRTSTSSPQIISFPCIAWLSGLIGSSAVRYYQEGLECIAKKRMGRGAIWIPVGKVSTSNHGFNILVCSEKGL